MNIRDIIYITSIAEAGSIGKAAEKLFVAQPSLSKCVKKVEKEYDISLFKRVKGVSVKLTKEGELFLEMARDIVISHSRFEEQLRRLKQQRDTLVLGLTYQRTVCLAGTILEKFYRENPQQILQIQTRDTQSLKYGLLDQSLDAVILATLDREDYMHYEPLQDICVGVRLRTGSPLAKKACFVDGIKYPVLRLEDLKNETFTVNAPGSSSRNIVERMLKQNEVSLEIMDVTNSQSRAAMVKSGIASTFVPVEKNGWNSSDKKENLYLIHPEQNINYQVYLTCLNEFYNTASYIRLINVVKAIFMQ